MQFKLTDLYNTRYFYITFAKDLTYLFNTYLRLREDKTIPYNIGNDLLGQVYEAAKNGTKVEFDLANCKLTPDVTVIIRDFAERGIDFIDTVDNCRNGILRINKQRRAIDTSQFIELPHYDPNITIKEYIQNLDKTVTYRTPTNNCEIYIPLVYMIFVTRPSIKICLDGFFCKEFFNFVGARLSLDDLYNYKEFYLTTPEGTKVVNFQNGKDLVQRLGSVDIEKALTVGTLVPTVLGREKLLNVPCWQGIFKECLNRLTCYRESQKKTLEEVLT